MNCLGCGKETSVKKGGRRGYCSSCYYYKMKNGEIGRVLLNKGQGIDFVRSVVESSRKEKIDNCIEYPYYKAGNGYGCLRYEGKYWRAHRLSLFLFTGENPEDMDCAHGSCHNRLCINPHHLSWKTRSENMQDAKRDGTVNWGENNGMSVLSEPEVIEIKNSLLLGVEEEVLAKKYNVTKSAIYFIKIDKTWSHIPWGNKDYKNKLIFNRKQKPKINDEVVNEVLERLLNQEKNIEIARDLGLKPYDISNIKRRKKQ